MKLDRFDEELDTLVANAVNDDTRSARLKELNRRRRRLIYGSILYAIVIVIFSFIVVRGREDAVFPFVLFIPLICGFPSYMDVVSEIRMLRIAGALKETLAKQSPTNVAGN